MNQLLAFYLGTGPDHRGRTLAEILRQDDLWFEITHDFIQWLFPLNELSRASLHAPLVDGATLHAFQADPLLRDHMRASVGRFLRFLGLSFDGESLRPGPNWPKRRPEWFDTNTHNSLRVTRVLKSMTLLGLSAEAAKLGEGFEALCAAEAGCGVSAESRAYWRQATCKASRAL
jgi:hypothetical protein